MSELDIYKKQNFGNRIGFGERTALLIVDFTVGFNDPAHFGGGNIDAAVKRTVGLLAHFRKTQRPVAHSRVVYADDGSDWGVFTMKAPALKTLTETAAIGQIVPELTPVAGELIVRKTQASAFFNTGLTAWLLQRRVDTVVVAGCTTSGCVRASVVDAVSNNLRTIIATDCVGDRAMGPHEANLFDMGQKYADLMARDEIIAALA
ncbi:MAG: isochorismatase family protein [Proteobacteria bacterium]|nr:isochorismatase family protein [Pseudomonadota bacterium]